MSAMAAIIGDLKEINSFPKAENTKVSVIRILDNVKRYQDRIRSHIEDNYVNFMPNRTTSGIYIEDGESLLRETDHLLKSVSKDSKLALSEADVELTQCVDELREVSLGLKLSYRILKIDDLFQCLEDSSANKDYLAVLNLLGKLKSYICGDNTSDVDRLFQKSQCYDAIQIKYHIQANILQQNLQQRFDRLVRFTEKSFQSGKNIMLQVSKDVVLLQDTVIALFQVRYNPMKLCDFLLDNCLVPMVTKPVSVEYSSNEEYIQLNVSYTIKEVNNSLRPSYKQVFAHITSLLDSLKNINVKVTSHQYVFGIIGSHVKEKFLHVLIENCLMNAVPETMDEYQESTIVDDVKEFEKTLADTFFIDPEIDRVLSNFVTKFDKFFQERFSNKILESARIIMQKDLQDMAIISEGNTPEVVKNDNILFPECMISKSTLELVKLIEQILRQPLKFSRSSDNGNLSYIIPLILNTYCSHCPKTHEKLFESIPQQAALFYNNCMYLAHWVSTNSELGIPTHTALVKTLQTAGINVFSAQYDRQQKILSQILKDLDVSDIHSIGPTPLKLIRQCLRQMDILKNVWLNVLPESVYNQTFCNIINAFCQDIIRRILSLNDISATVANELSELIQVILDKAPGLFKERHQVVQVTLWMKLQQLQTILNASLQEITELWCDGAGILTANYKVEEVRHLVRALFQNTDRRAKALTRII